MSTKKKQPEEKPSGSLLGWLALFAVIAAVAVFAFTRSPEVPQPPAPSVAAKAPPLPEPASPAPASTEPVAAAPESTPPPAAEPSPAPPISSPSPVSSGSTETHAEDVRIPAYFENPDAAEPLDPTLDPTTVKPYAKAAYEVAQRKPRLLAQLPCFCYCDRFGHKSLHDCYASNHAEECDICMREALDADQMDAQGMTPQEIREAIVAAHQHGS